MRNILVLFTTAIFLLVGASNLEAQNRKGNKGQLPGNQSEKTTTQRAQAVTLKLTETLKLDKEQSAKVEAIYLDFLKEQETCLKENKKGDKPKKGREPNAKYVERHKVLETELSKVLTKEQMTQYKKEMEERKSKRANKPQKPRGKQ